MRSSAILFLLVASCSSDPAAPAPAAETGEGTDTAIADTSTEDTATVDGATDSPADGDKDATVATCLDVADGTGAAPTSGSAKVKWARTYVAGGSTSSVTGTAIATFVSGATDDIAPKFGTVDITPKSSVGKTGYIAKLHDDGSADWVRGVTGVSTSDYPRPSLAMVGSEVAFAHAGTAPFAIADKMVTGTGSTIAFGVLRDDGTTRSFTTFPATDGKVLGIAADAAGLVHVVAAFGKPVDIAGKTLDCDFVLMVLDADAKPKWGRCVSTPKGSIYSVDGFGVDSAGNSYISGFPVKEIDVGDGSKTVDNSFGASVLFKVDPAGKTLWSQIWLGAYARALAIAGDGTIYTFGHVPKPTEVTIAGSLLRKCDMAFDYNITKLDTAGKRLWTKMLGSASLDSLALATDGVWFGSQPSGVGEIAKGLPAPKTVAVGKLSSDGKLALLQTFPASDPTATPFSGGLFGAAGEAVFAGQMTADFTAGTSTVTKKGGYSDVVLRIAP